MKKLISISVIVAACAIGGISLPRAAEANGAAIKAASGVTEPSPPIGKWGMVFAGLQMADSKNCKSAYELGYQEIEFNAGGTYTWYGWVWGKQFRKSGVWHREKDRIVMEDK